MRIIFLKKDIHIYLFILYVIYTGVTGELQFKHYWSRKGNILASCLGDVPSIRSRIKDSE